MSSTTQGYTHNLTNDLPLRAHRHSVSSATVANLHLIVIASRPTSVYCRQDEVVASAACRSLTAEHRPSSVLYASTVHCNNGTSTPTIRRVKKYKGLLYLAIAFITSIKFTNTK